MSATHERRSSFIEATAEVLTVSSYQSWPDTDRPYKIRGVSRTAKTTRHVSIALTQAQARKLVRDWVSFGLFGQHGRVETTPKP